MKKSLLLSFLLSIFLALTLTLFQSVDQSFVAEAVDCTCPFGAVPTEDGTCICPSNLPATPGGGCGLQLNLPICKEGQVSTKSSPCQCATGAQKSEDGICKCLGRSPYTGEDCPSTDFCLPGEESRNITTGQIICFCAGDAMPSGGTIGICRCPRGRIYTVDGCFQHPCAPDEKPTSLNECFCAQGAGESLLTGFCACTDGSTYTAEQGCRQAIFGMLTGTLCEPLEASNEVNKCICPDGAVFDSDYACKCTNGQPYIGTCEGSRTCGSSERPSAKNPCHCAPGGSVVSRSDVCRCTDGKLYSNVSGCTSPITCTTAETPTTPTEPSPEEGTVTPTEGEEEETGEEVFLNPDFSGIWKGVVKSASSASKSSRLLTLRLCTSGDQIEGSVKQGTVIDNGVIISQQAISEDEVIIEVADEQDNIVELELTLVSKKRLKVKFVDSVSVIARKIKLNRECEEFRKLRVNWK